MSEKHHRPWRIGSAVRGGGVYIRDAAGVVGISSAVTAGDDIRFWAGHATMASAPFKVTEAGALTATNATISGAVTATSGAIGGFSIGSDYIRDAADSFGMASTIAGGPDVRFWAGDTFANRAIAPFIIREDGSVQTANLKDTGTISSVGGIKAYEGTSIPAGGTATVGFTFSTNNEFGVFFGSGAPTLEAAKGSLYLRSDGTTTNDRAYINTNGISTWTALTTAA